MENNHRATAYKWFLKISGRFKGWMEDEGKCGFKHKTILLAYIEGAPSKHTFLNRNGLYKRDGKEGFKSS